MTSAERLAELQRAENTAYEALMNDPAVIANPMVRHTPELLEAWEAAAEAERLFRENMEAAQ